MGRAIKSISVRCFVAWTLAFGMVLSLAGCAGGQTSSGDSTAQSTAASAASSDQTADSAQPIDYSKYNAYLRVLESVYEMDGLLSTYFTVVQNQPDFALADGMDYGALKDDFTFYNFNSYTMEEALGYCDEDPDYPEQDELLTALNEPYLAMGEVLDNIAEYVAFDDYVDDNMAQAAQLHSQLYAALSAFDAAAWPFEESMIALDDATEQQELDRLKAEGMDIAYYSRLMFNVADQIDAEVWRQISQAEGGTLPVLDMTALEPLYAQHQEAYAGLATALADPDKAALQWSNEGLREANRSYYERIASNADVTLGNFMQQARNQEDYSESYDSYFSYISTMIDQYNNSN